MRVTFDTNTLDKAARPERSPKDPRQAGYLKVHRALSSGVLKGYFSETIITLEGVENTDRIQVFGGTQATVQEVRPYRSEDDREIVPVTIAVEQNRKPLHLEHSARVRAALGLGMRVLRGPPRIGWLRIEDPEGKIFEPDGSETQLPERLDRSFAVGEAIEARGVGYATFRQLAANFAARHGVQEFWFKSLGRARDVHEQNAVKRAVNEWADGDTIIAHYAYKNDYLCSEDYGKAGGLPSIFDLTNRDWLEATYSIKFVTLTQLAGMV